MLGKQAQITVVIFKRSVKIVPGMIQLNFRRRINQVVDDKFIVAVILYHRDKIVVFGNVVGVIERLRHGVFIRRRWFAVRVGRQ